MTKSICVVGAGLAGGIVASQLSKHGCRVTLVELGDKPEPFESGNEDWELDKPKAAFTRGRGTGGTSNFWHGGLTMLDRADVEGRSAHFGDTKYPLRHVELRPYYERALDLMHGGRGLSLEDIEGEPERAGNEFKIHAGSFRYKGLVYPARPFSTRGLIEESRRRHGLTVVSDCEIERVNFSSRSRVVALEGRERIGRAPRVIEADVVVLCAGGIGSPKILLESARASAALQGLPIGRFIIDHPTGFVFKAKLRRRMHLRSLFGQRGKGCRIQHGFALKPDQLDISGGRNHILFLRPAVSMKDPLLYDFLKRILVGYKGKRLKPSDVAYLLKHTDLLFEAVNFKFGLFNSTRYVSGLTFAEQFPNDQDRISTKETGSYSIRWRVSEEDSSSLSRFLEAFFRCHADMFEEFKVFPEISRRLETAGHHSGGCRMSSDPSRGVVDGDLRVHGVDNLFVVDGSVLGYSGHANSGFTIAALAVKCTDAVRGSC